MAEPSDDVEPDTPPNVHFGCLAHYAPQLATAAAGVAALPPAHRALFERELAGFMKRGAPWDT